MYAGSERDLRIERYVPELTSHQKQNRAGCEYLANPEPSMVMFARSHHVDLAGCFSAVMRHDLASSNGQLNPVAER
jgi:hypothetical protein